jgi:hypothetical protein
MKKPAIQRLWGLLCAVLILSACQKEVSTPEGQTNENNLSRTTGALPDDPSLVEKVHTIMSSDFYNLPSARGGKTGKQTDSDGDGIYDANDACPTQKETFNGYQDTDGCPDTAPTTSTDSDADGIPDASDGCPTQKETFNGYQDSDGCPDTPPTVVSPTTLPASHQLSMPPVQNQGAEFSCVAFAVGYAARSAEQYYKTNSLSYSYSSNVFSPEFLYNQTKLSDCGSGTSILKALDFLKAAGIATWQSMPYSSTNGCSLMPTSSQTTQAAGFKIASYSKILNTDQTAIKTMLVNKHPLIFMVAVDQSLMNATAGFIWKAYSGTPGFYHAMAICGYDDAKHAYKVINSWGTAWGDAGYTWIDYDFLPKASYNSYVINL